MLVLMLGGLTGCSILAPFYFVAVLAGMDDRIPPPLEIPEDPAAKKADTPERILVVTYVPESQQIELGRIDRDLNEVIASRLALGFYAENKNFAVIYADKLADWQDEHPDWRSVDANEIGRTFKADYVIYIEVSDLTYFGHGSGRTLLQGKANLMVSVIRVGPDRGERLHSQKLLSVEYPTGRFYMATEKPFKNFRHEFLQHIAERVAWLFLPHATGDEFGRDPI
jgi:hypothetical protein